MQSLVVSLGADQPFLERSRAVLNSFPEVLKKDFFYKVETLLEETLLGWGQVLS